MKATLNALALVVGCALAGSAFGQCTLDSTISSSPFTVPGNTCGKNLGLTSFCSGGNVPNGAGTSVVQINVGNSANFGLRLISTTTGFSPELAFVAGACSSLTACTIDDTRGPLPQQTVPPPAGGTGYSDAAYDGPAPQPAPGIGFAIISDLNAEAPGCGAYTLEIIGTLPVKLQGFSVQ